MTVYHYKATARVHLQNESNFPFAVENESPPSVETEPATAPIKSTGASTAIDGILVSNRLTRGPHHHQHFTCMKNNDAAATYHDWRVG